jgi:DNA-binding PadR family transcriptional regulator
VTRIFKRGELQQALLDALGHLGEANGYAIMQALGEQVGSGWRPSPGAIYPALLGLEDAGLIRGVDNDGSRTYVLTASGTRALDDASGTLERVAERARLTPVRPTAGSMLDAFVAGLAGRSRRLDPTAEVKLRDVLDGMQAPIEAITTGGEQ